MARTTKYTHEDFLYIQKALLQHGFTQKSTISFKKDFKRLGLEAPRNLQGREEGFFYSENNLTVWVWTTYLASEQKFRDVGTDMGWVLITEGDDVRYFAKPIKRDNGFIVNLLSKAWVAQCRVKYRPLCPVCHAYMQIVRKKTNACCWGCFKLEYHPSTTALPAPSFLRWDDVGPQGSLPQKAKEYVTKLRKGVALYKAKNRKKGITRTPAALLRKKWIVHNPQNKIMIINRS